MIIPKNVNKISGGSILEEIIMDGEIDVDSDKIQDIRKIVDEVGSEEEKAQLMNTDLDQDGQPKFQATDFIIAENLDDVDLFQNSIKEGVYLFSKWEQQKDNSWGLSSPQGWETMGTGAMTEELDTSDDAQAEADFQKTQTKLQKLDKKLELRLDQLETERQAIQTEIESVSKVIDDNVESTFKVFS